MSSTGRWHRPASCQCFRWNPDAGRHFRWAFWRKCRPETPGPEASGWESTIYALGNSQILRIARPEAASEDQVRARAAFTAGLPPLPFAVPRVREISRMDGQLFVIEDRIAGQSMATLLPGLSGERRATALRAYLAAAEAISAATAPGEAFGDLLLDRPRR